ncbi:MAG: putative secreted protein [uncultured Frankineae bacterium]|uniref:Putative secreted protein n=1 Tax=uncultured Frankineae bacterium TaxID=437475 RepID=A0A6J4MCL9_9ACTN|nr:MAG: putative secreted protein [uncultured Frankineae bacterium]
MVLTAGGAWAVGTGLTSSSSGPPAPAALTVAPPSPSPSPTPSPSSVADAAVGAPPDAQVLDTKTLPRARPVSLRIPSIGVQDPALVDLGKQPDGSLEVPADPADPGWFSPGPAPGQFGPAVIAGHVDGGGGPGVFYRLGELQPGAQVEVVREDGSVARFVVDKVERYRKDAFPTAAVYGDSTHRAELRLITCGGAFDDETGHYVDNVVAYAHLV